MLPALLSKLPDSVMIQCIGATMAGFVIIGLEFWTNRGTKQPRASERLAAIDFDGDFETGRPCYSDYGYRSQCMLRTKANLPQFGKTDVLYSTNTPGEYFAWTGTAYCEVVLK